MDFVYRLNSLHKQKLQYMCEMPMQMILGIVTDKYHNTPC